jgi:hypothetical protein
MDLLIGIHDVEAQMQKPFKGNHNNTTEILDSCGFWLTVSLTTLLFHVHHSWWKVCVGTTPKTCAESMPAFAAPDVADGICGWKSKFAPLFTKASM